MGALRPCASDTSMPPQTHAPIERIGPTVTKLMNAMIRTIDAFERTRSTAGFRAYPKLP